MPEGSNVIWSKPPIASEVFIIWKFSSSAKLEIACNVPGHYEAGMIAKIIKD